MDAKFFHVCGIPLIPWDETRREVRPNEMEIPNRGAASGPAGSERGPAGCPFARAGRARCADRPDRTGSKLELELTEMELEITDDDPRPKGYLYTSGQSDYYFIVWMSSNSNVATVDGDGK